jgi:membrane-bound serine protease (ClpP class)
MNSWFLACLAFFSALLAPVSAAEPGPVVVVPLKTEVSAAQFFFLRRALKQAEREGASAFVIDMETYGGDVKAAIDNMDALLKTRVPTFTYINPRAISAGALIALATQKIYMAPSGVIGAAAPVMAGGEDLPKTMTEKAVSMLSAMARAAAEKNGHRAELADAFINKEKEVKIGEVVIDKGDSLLTLSAPEAVKLYDGKPLLAAGVADSLEAMLQQAGLTGRVETVQPSGFEQVAFWITALAPVFLLGGLLGAYIEFKTPGFGLPGFVSVCCFAVFFTGHYIAGLAGWEVGALFFVGLLLVLGELFLHPGTIIPGLVGALLMVGALLWAMIDRYPGEPFLPTTEMLMRPLVNLAVAFLFSLLAAYWLAKYLPRTSLYHHIVLERAVGGSLPSAVPAASPADLGQAGIARTMLRPAGKAEFGGHVLDVVTQGDFIDPGSHVRIVAVDGLRVVVELV